MESLPINPTDLVVVVVVFVSAVLAFFRGFVQEALAISGWVVAFLGARQFGARAEPLFAGLIDSMPRVKDFVQQYLAYDMVVTVLGLAGTFALILALCAIITHFVARTVQRSALNAVDRSLGFAFGVARGALLVSLAYLLATWIWTTDDQPPWLKDAQTRTLLASGADFLKNIAPEGLRLDDMDKKPDARDEDKASGIQIPEGDIPLPESLPQHHDVP